MDRDFKKKERDEHVVDLLSAYIDNALNPGERESIRAHIETCDSCRIEHDGLIGMKAMLKSLPIMPPPRAFTLTPEMVSAGARRESFWQRLLTPRAVPRFATGSVIAFALLIFLLVGDFAGMGRDAAFAPYAETSSAPASESARNSDVALKAAPTTNAAEGGAAVLPPVTADATATTGSAGTDQTNNTTGIVESASDATPQTGISAFEPDASATVSVQDAFVAKQPVPLDGLHAPDESGGNSALPAIKLALAAIGALLAIGAFVARRRGV